MANQLLKNLWFYANVAFFFSYSLVILRIFVAFPLPALPSFINCLLLLVSYSLTFQGLASHLKAIEVNTVIRKMLTHPNMFCIFLFLCFVPNILLFPFYLLSIYHIVSSVVARKEIFHKYFFYDLAVFLNTNIHTIGRLALLFEILLIPVACGLAALRRIGLFSLVTYLAMIRQQYVSNGNMKAVVAECVQYAHDMSMKLPDSVKMRCLGVVNRVAAVTREAKPEAQKQ